MPKTPPKSTGGRKKMEHERGLDADATEEGRQRADMPQVGKPKRPVADPEMDLKTHNRRQR
jgi:hypothetical protein